MGRAWFGKFRLDRGVLRWWLLVVGLVVIDTNWTLFFVGTGLVWTGAVLHFISKGYLRQNRVLTRSGPYRFCRNPFYLANLIAETGLIVIIGQWWVGAVYLPVWFYVYGRQIRKEEAKLVRIFGEEFEAYRRAVPRLCPLPWRVGPKDASGFSWRNPNILAEGAVERSLRLASYPLLLLAMDQMQDLRWASVNEFDDWAPWLLAGFVALFVLGLWSSMVLPRLCEKTTTPAVG